MKDEALATWKIFGMLARQFNESKSSKRNKDISPDKISDVYASLLNDTWINREDSEEIFGILLSACGLAAALANALVLFIAFKHLKSRNVLFIIITNFALIDEFKALCGIYIGVTYLRSEISHDTSPMKYYKTLQVSLFILYFGNICSVLNLILAVINELLYIKLPLQYFKVVKKWRVFTAVVLIWATGLCFSLLKGIHGGSGTSSILINMNMSDPIQPKRYTPKEMYKRPGYGAVTDVYALILVAVLMVCLIVVGATYLCLYFTIRRASFFHKESVRSKMSHGSFSLTNDSPDLIVSVNNSYSLRRNVSSRLYYRQSYDSQTQTNFSTTNNGSLSDRQSFRNPHQTIPVIMVRHKPRRDSRLLKRHKCIIVILSVCGLYIVYLSIYFSLQLFHVIHIVKGLNQAKLRERYIINLILRSMFVLQASLNPLLFFRIKTFRLSVIKFYRALTRCKKDTSPVPKMSRPSMVEFSVPAIDN